MSWWWLVPAWAFGAMIGLMFNVGAHVDEIREREEKRECVGDEGHREGGDI